MMKGRVTRNRSQMKIKGWERRYRGERMAISRSKRNRIRTRWDRGWALG